MLHMFTLRQTFLLAFCQVHLLQSLLLVYDSLFLKAMKKKIVHLDYAAKYIHPILPINALHQITSEFRVSSRLPPS